MKKNKGFTLIELLIVIAILGILALTLIAAIDPFEQLKKGRDTALKNTTTEVYNASLRYYANQAVFPWGSSIPTTPLSGMAAYITALTENGELKTNFLGLLGGNATKIYVHSTSAEHAAVCFQPESKAGQKEWNTMYDNGGASSGGCKSGGGTTNCWWCIQ